MSEVNDAELNTLISFHKELLILTKLVSECDCKNKNEHVKNFVSYVERAPVYGLDKIISPFQEELKSLYIKNKADILEGFDDWIFKPDPLLLKANRKIYLPIGNIYQRTSEANQDRIFSQLLKVMLLFASEESEIDKLKQLSSTKDSKPQGPNGMPFNIGGIFDAMFGGKGGENNQFKTLITDMAAKVAAVIPQGEINDPSEIDANKIAQLVKDLISDKSENGILGKLSNSGLDLDKLSKESGVEKLINSAQEQKFEN